MGLQAPQDEVQTLGHYSISAMPSRIESSKRSETGMGKKTGKEKALLNAGDRRQNGFPETVPEMAVVRAGPGIFSGGGGENAGLVSPGPSTPG